MKLVGSFVTSIIEITENTKETQSTKLGQSRFPSRDEAIPKNNFYSLSSNSSGKTAIETEWISISYIEPYRFHGDHEGMHSPGWQMKRDGRVGNWVLWSVNQHGHLSSLAYGRLWRICCQSQINNSLCLGVKVPNVFRGP